MDFQRLKQTNVLRVFVAVAIIVLIVSIISFQQQIQGKYSRLDIDKGFIPAMKDISSILPDDSVLVVSTMGPYVTYFTGHLTKVPWGVSSEDSLIKYMTKGHYDYLLVFEGRSDVAKLKSLFSSEGLKSLEDNFQKKASYSADFSKIYLYQLNPQQSTQITREELLGYWDFENDTVKDASIYANDGTINGASNVDGKIGKALLFNGTSDYISVPDNDMLDFGALDSFTVVAWVETNNNGSTEYAVSKLAGPLSSNAGWALRKLSTDLFTFSISDGKNEVSSSSNLALNDGNWHFVVGVRDTDAGKLFLYIDGVLQNDQPDDTPASLENPMELRIGNRGDNKVPWEGKIDEVRVYNRALTPIEVENLYLRNTLQGENIIESAGGRIDAKNSVR